MKGILPSYDDELWLAIKDANDDFHEEAKKEIKGFLEDVPFYAPSQTLVVEIFACVEEEKGESSTPPKVDLKPLPPSLN